MIISGSDQSRLSGMFPDLVFEENQIKGNLIFSAEFIDAKKTYELLDPNNPASINGSFQILIDLTKQNPYREVYELGGEIQKMANRLQKTLLDLHAQEKNNDINVCVAGYSQENQDISLIEFICEVVVPYFCDLIFFEKYDYWPRGEYAHGALGILESYSDQLVITDDISGLTEKCINELSKQKKNFACLKPLLFLKKKLNGDWTCFPNNKTNKKFRDIIGKKAFDGLWKLKDNLKKYHLLSKIEL